MDTQKLAFLLLLQIASPTTLAQQEDDSADMCKVAATAADSAARLRDSGKKKEDLERVLPTREDALKTPTGRAMYRALDQAFGFPKIGPFSHYYFSFYTCLSGKQQDKPSLNQAALGISECEHTYGKEVSKELGNCLMKAIESATH